MKENYGSTMIQALKTVLPIQKKMKAQEKRWITLLISREDGEKLLEIKRQAVDKLKFLGKFVDGNKSKWPYRLFEKTYVKFNRMQKEHQEKGEWMDKSPVLE